MRRKLVKQGRNALTVTLPAVWVAKNNLTPGSEVFVEERENGLFISGSEGSGGSKKSIDISNQDPMIKRILGALYKAGHNEVEVRFENSRELEAAQEVIREEFIGFEIVHHSKNMIVVKDVSKIDPNEFNTMMRRTYLIIKSMGEDCLEATKKHDAEFLKMIALRDKDVNKLSDFCRRAINKHGHILKDKPTLIYYIAEQLEKVGDLYRDLCRFLAENQIKQDKELIEFFYEVNAFFVDFYNLYFDFDAKKIREFGERRHCLIEKSGKLNELYSKKETQFIFYLRSITENIFDMNGALIAAKL